MQKIPSDDLSEKSFIGCLIFNLNLFRQVKGDINEDHFFNKRNRDIFKVLLELHEKGQSEASYPTIDALLKKMGSSASLEYVIALTDQISVSQFMIYCKNIKESHEKREVLRIAYKAVKSINEGNESNDVKNELKSAISNEISTLDFNYSDHISEMAEKTAIKFRDIGKKIYATGIDFIDSPIYSLMPSETVFIVAEGGLGKSTIAKEIALYMAKNGVACCFESLEMTKESFYTSIINSEMSKQRPDHDYLTLVDALKDHKEPVAEFYRSQTKENIFLFDKPTTYLSDLRKHLRIVKNVSKKDVCLFIDSFSQLHIAGKFNSQTEKENAISIEITQLAKEENVPIIIIHHNNKDGKFRGSEKLKDNAWWWISLEPVSGETDSDYINPKWVKTREYRGEFKKALFKKVKGSIEEIKSEIEIQNVLSSSKEKKSLFQ
jgi:replicative DNA helicase